MLYTQKPHKPDKAQLIRDHLYLVDDPIFENNIDDIYSKILVQIISKYKPEIFLAGATSFASASVSGGAATGPAASTPWLIMCWGASIPRRPKTWIGSSQRPQKRPMSYYAKASGRQ